MSFLFPAVLWGLIAVSLPIIIHLISLRHTKTVDFSTIRHIKALEHETIRKLKIRQWILILLRMGIISALVLMVSGPILMNDSLWIPSENESTAVIIIDNSASMAVMKDRHTYLDKVKAELCNIASSEDIFIVEDATYSELYFHEKQPTPLFSLDNSNKVIKLGTFSKIISTGIRVGWVQAHESIIQACSQTRFDMGNSPLIHRALSLYLSNNLLNDHVNEMRQIY